MGLLSYMYVVISVT